MVQLAREDAVRFLHVGPVAKHLENMMEVISAQ
jgi:hypothetical protein